MSGGTGAVTAAGCGGAHAALEDHSGAGTAIHPWPLHSHLELAALPTAVSCLRNHARLVVREWGLPASQADTAALVVSELVTNAIRASDGLTSPVVRLWLISDRQRLLIQVWDGSDQMPARRDAHPDSESGRGLMIVDAVAEEWGARPVDGGKVIWAVV